MVLCVVSHDQCPLGTRACLTTVNQKDGESDRVVSVIPLSTSESVVEYSSLSCRRCTFSRCGARLLMAVLY